MNFENILQAAKDKVKEITPNDVLKVVGLQLLRNPGVLMRLPFFALFGGGVALGAGAALLFAPKTGAETREAIGTWVKGAITSAKDIGKKAKAKAEDVAEDAGQAIEEGANGIKRKVAHKAKSIARESEA